MSALKTPLLVFPRKDEPKRRCASCYLRWSERWITRLSTEAFPRSWKATCSCTNGRIRGLGIHQRKVELPLNTRRRNTGSGGSCFKYADAEFCFVSEVKAFFRHCPSCGRRFHIKLVRKEEVAEEPITEHLTPAEEEMGYGFIHANPWMTQLTEGPPIYVDIEEFDYTYKCTHCGHQWSEVHTEQDTARN